MTRPGNVDFLDMNINIIQQTLTCHISALPINDEPQGIITSNDSLNGIDEQSDRECPLYVSAKSDIEMRTTRRTHLGHPYPALIFSQWT